MAEVNVIWKLVSEPYVPNGKSVVAFLKSFHVVYSEDKDHCTAQRAVYTSFTKYARAAYRKYT